MDGVGALGCTTLGANTATVRGACACASPSEAQPKALLSACAKRTREIRCRDDGRMIDDRTSGLRCAASFWLPPLA